MNKHPTDSILDTLEIYTDGHFMIRDVKKALIEAYDLGKIKTIEQFRFSICNALNDYNLAKGVPPSLKEIIKEIDNSFLEELEQTPTNQEEKKI